MWWTALFEDSPWQRGSPVQPERLKQAGRRSTCEQRANIERDPQVPARDRRWLNRQADQSICRIHRSPLTDSNRRPPPYHSARERYRGQARGSPTAKASETEGFAAEGVTASGRAFPRSCSLSVPLGRGADGIFPLSFAVDLIRRRGWTGSACVYNDGTVKSGFPLGASRPPSGSSVTATVWPASTRRVKSATPGSSNRPAARGMPSSNTQIS
jgi:hypothetical protein